MFRRGRGQGQFGRLDGRSIGYLTRSYKLLVRGTYFSASAFLMSP